MQKLNKFKEDFHKRFCSWNCPIWFKNMQSFLQIIVNAKVFEIFIVMCIIVNTIFLAADHHDADDNLKNALSIGNSGKSIFLRPTVLGQHLTDLTFFSLFFTSLLFFQLIYSLVFTYIFAAEAFLKILALGFITYLKDPWNTFDFVIVIISISDVFISLTSPENGENQNSGLNVLRTLRYVFIEIYGFLICLHLDCCAFSAWLRCGELCDVYCRLLQSLSWMLDT